MGEDPTHPPGFCKVHGYTKEWCGLLIRGCIAKTKLGSKHSFKQEKPSSLLGEKSMLPLERTIMHVVTCLS